MLTFSLGWAMSKYLLEYYSLLHTMAIVSIMLHTSLSHLFRFPCFFYFSFFQVFGRLLGPRSFDSPKGLLAHKQAFPPITFGDIGLIPTFTINPTTYLGSWALLALIITVRFMVDQHPFLLKALVQIDSNTFFF
jgi:hypothetical protein